MLRARKINILIYSYQVFILPKEYELMDAYVLLNIVAKFAVLAWGIGPL